MINKQSSGDGASASCGRTIITRECSADGDAMFAGQKSRRVWLELMEQMGVGGAESWEALSDII